MSNRKRRTADKPAFVPPGGPAVAIALEDRPDPRRMKWWIYAAVLVAALLVAFEVYGPALNGEFLFDDEYLPFAMPEMQNSPLIAWSVRREHIRVGIR